APRAGEARRRAPVRGGSPSVAGTRTAGSPATSATSSSDSTAARAARSTARNQARLQPGTGARSDGRSDRFVYELPTTTGDIFSSARADIVRIGLGCGSQLLRSGKRRDSHTADA